MFQVETEATLDALAARLAKLLAKPLDDPMTPEWIVVGSAGTERWLRLELSRRLGSSGEGRSDGVAANLRMLFPRRFEQEVLAPDVDTVSDPWKLERVAWAIVEVLQDGTDPALGPLRSLAPGATQWGRARRLADLFDGYLHHRPEMIRLWAGGEDVDDTGERLVEHHAWQPHLWRLVRERIGCPSPAEVRPELLRTLRCGVCPASVPARVALFGLSTIPGGTPFLDLLKSLGEVRDVHLMFREVSPARSRKVARVALAGGPSQSSRRGHLPGLVAADGAGALEAEGNPLVASWARPSAEATALLCGCMPAGQRSEGPPGQPANLLAKIRYDITFDRPPSGDFRLGLRDRSIRIHTCHGATRQVEVLRDQILHFLADDPTLREDDIVVACPAIDSYAPLVEAVFGPPAGSQADGHDRKGSPGIAYTIADRSLERTISLFAALLALLDLLASRFSVEALIDFIARPRVRRRFELSDADLDQIVVWAATANTRWGLDAGHRARWGIPDSYDAGSLRKLADRLLIGVATTERPELLAVGGISPIAVEGDGVALSGRFAALLHRLSSLEDEARRLRSPAQWVSLLREAIADLFASDAEGLWQERRLARVLEQVEDDATISGSPASAQVSLADIRQLLARHLQGAAGRTDFFRGGVTFCSLTPLRGVPFRVVCLLGLDEASLPAVTSDGDDIKAGRSKLGDSDPRAETRQAILETLLASRDHLVITRSGRSVVTNQRLPASVVVSELTDVIRATLRAEGREDAMATIEIVHPRQSFDEANFAAGPSALDPAQAPWSFDPLARAGAAGRAAQQVRTPPCAVALRPKKPTDIALDDLRDFLVHPVRYFVRRVLGVDIPASNLGRGNARLEPSPTLNAPGSAFDGRGLVIDLDELETWDLSDRLLRHRLGGGDHDSFVRALRARDLLPPGRWADRSLDTAEGRVGPILAELAAEGIWPSVLRSDGQASASPPPGYDGELAWQYVPVDVRLADGTRIAGTVTVAPSAGGPLQLSVSRSQDKDQLAPWLGLVALCAASPATPWRAVLINRPDTASKRSPAASKRILEVSSGEADGRRDKALEALSVTADLFRRAERGLLPLFPRLSPALAAGASPALLADLWRPFKGRGDGDDEWVRFAFDDPQLADVLSLAVKTDDPPGPGDDRATRYAKLLWGAVTRSVTPSTGSAP